MTPSPRWVPHSNGSGGYLILNEDPASADPTEVKSIPVEAFVDVLPDGTVHGIMIRGIPAMATSEESDPDPVPESREGMPDEG